MTEDTEAYITSIVNQKGGVGKTTTTTTLSHALGLLKKKVLVIDLDPQSNSSHILGQVPPNNQPVTIADMFKEDKDLQHYIVTSKYKNVDLVPSSIQLFTMRNQMIGTVEGILGLKQKINNEIKLKYDYILIDCPPDIGGPLVTNALVVSDFYIVPIAAEDIFGLDGFQQLSSSIEAIQLKANSKLKLLSVLITMADKRSTATDIMTQTILKRFDSKVFKTIIKRNAAINSATFVRKTVIAHDGRTPGAIDYKALAQEFINKFEN